MPILEAHKKFTLERNFDRFQTPKNLSMALSVEVAELVEIFIWMSEQQSLNLSEEKLNAAADEVADVFIYLLRLADKLGIDLIKAADQKLKKNIEKYSIEKSLKLAEALLD